ncbi:hypothetical protein E3Q18_00341 [Wallemia mellicola]|uniref:HypA-like protein n=1 Tax=Wallemia mellicola TaxID=1708541 RepID=A0A4T0SZS5_9BASI|nr:hypothetical protein E3Q18_00341 [Wallemia mellicola]TIC05900.1 hypothetical protein E3Q16_01598 [Wallemia mellicola]TIC37874.1 hypothetical protein E3Q09_00538 [Wallemia mellicola]TIC57420.1 hypothetical protein E3Q04_00500 [Wallemia mellicola]TIC67198.1 hypothetical protein E3Q02_01560 [Wallemia mellicola]
MNNLIRSSLWPGISSNSTKLVRSLTDHDFAERDAYFNRKGFHNHFIHGVYAAYSLGAQPKTIQRIADALASYQQPLRPVEKGTPINQSNWNDKQLLGKRDNYPTYLNYFREEVDKTKDTASLLDKYIYSRIANEVGVDMLSRFFSGLIHPIIHLGYALEFEHVDNKREVLAQALAWTATHPSDFSAVLPQDLWSNPEKENAQRKSSLQVYFDVLKDEKYSANSPDTPTLNHDFPVSATVKSAGGMLLEEASHFDLPASDIPKRQDELCRELAYTAMLMYASGGYKAGKKFKPEFILVHILNSSHFIPFILHYTPSAINKRLLLSAYFRVILTVYVSRGRPSLDAEVIKKREIPEDETNIWLGIVDDGLKQDDEHVLKAIRTLAFHDSKYSEDVPPEVSSVSLDGSIWSRVAHQHINAFKSGSAWSYERPGFEESWANDQVVYDCE